MKRNLLSLRIFTAAILLTGLSKMNAQQDPYMTHYAFNRSLFNPAVAGANGQFCASVLSHYQYLGYEDRTPEFYPDPNNPSNLPKAEKNVGPKTNAFTFTAPITKYGGLGIAFMSDKLGYEESTNIKVSAAGRYPMLSGANISVGFEVNFLQKGLDGTKLKPLAPLDPKIPSSNVKDMHPVFGAGVYYLDPMANAVSTRDFWAGISVLGLNSPEFVYNTGSSPDVVFSTPTKHIYVSGGITMLNFMNNPDLEFLPSVMFKMNRGVFQTDLTALAKYQGRLWGGIAYRGIANKFNSDAFSILLGYSGFKGNLQGLRIGYSYDLTLSKILSVSSGSHEIQLNYCFIIVPVVKERIKLVTPPFMHRESD